MKPILCLEFDGVIHSYTSGWKGPRNIPDPPVEKAIESILRYLESFEVHIYSSRSKYFGGRMAMKKWLLHHWIELMYQPHDLIPEIAISWLANLETYKIDVETSGLSLIKAIKWPLMKPPEMIQIDDRALTFKGLFPSAEELLKFKTWNKLNVEL